MWLRIDGTPVIGGLTLVNGRLVDVNIKPVYTETDRQRLHRKLVNA